MLDPVQVDLFCEDEAHDAFLRGLVIRLCKEYNRRPRLGQRKPLGGHGRVLNELKLYNRAVEKGFEEIPDILVVGIDANCSGFNQAKNAVSSCLGTEAASFSVLATPDPHVEKWFFLDPNAFRSVVGSSPSISWNKCERYYYKNALKQACREAGQPTTLDGIEFAEEIIQNMDLYRAGQKDNGFRILVSDLSAALKM
jgi:hypothetical protein